MVALALLASACGTSMAGTQTQTSSPAAASTTTSSTASLTSSSTTSTTSTSTLPGSGKPPVTIGDKNYTEQFILGELYRLALAAQGFSVQLNQNIGPTDVSLQALKSGALGMYPEYLDVFNTSVAKYTHEFRSRRDAYHAAQHYALNNGMVLLDPTPFSDTNAIGVTVGYAQANRLRAIQDLAKVQSTLTLGGPPESQQSGPSLSEMERIYGFSPKALTPLPVGSQYSALNNGTVQAAEVQTTDGQLASGDYRLLADPADVFGWGNVVPVVSSHVLAVEGPVFSTTIDRVSSLLTIPVIRALNQAVDVSGQSPSTVAQQFLETHGVIPPSSP
jgi:osmoprotectant transport system substrate-binding protein